MTEAGILTGHEIVEQHKAGRIRIYPFVPERVNPGSYDLTLGSKVAVYKNLVVPDFEPMEKDGIPGECIRVQHDVDPHIPFRARPGINCLDAAMANEIAVYEMDNRGFLLRPGIGYLMHTAERVQSDSFVPVIDGKSSIGRLFILVHFTAGYGEIGFDGQYTLEVMATHPVIIYPGEPIAQIRFHTTRGKVESYQGNYQGQDAMGPVASKSHKQIEACGLRVGHHSQPMDRSRDDV
jgi:dCTP deaminase